MGFFGEFVFVGVRKKREKGVKVRSAECESVLVWLI